MGELVVFIFFGLVAVIGTDYIQTGGFSFVAFIAGCISGCFATAVLLINNIRDIQTDKASGKKTLASRIGKKPALFLFDLLILVPFVLVAIIWALAPAVFIVNVLIILAIIILIIANTAKTPKEQILALALTSYLSLLFAFGFTWGLFAVIF